MKFLYRIPLYIFIYSIFNFINCSFLKEGEEEKIEKSLKIFEKYFQRFNFSDKGIKKIHNLDKTYEIKRFSFQEGHFELIRDFLKKEDLSLFQKSKIFYNEENTEKIFDILLKYLRQNENNIFLINELSKKNEIKGFFGFEKDEKDLLHLRLSFLEGKKNNFEFLEVINFLQSNLKFFYDYSYLSEDFKLGFSGPIKNEDTEAYWCCFSNRLPKEPYFLLFKDNSRDICLFEEGNRLSRQCLFTQQKFKEVMEINNSIFLYNKNKNYIDKNLLSKGILFEEKNNSFIEIKSFLELSKIYNLNERYFIYRFLKGMKIKKNGKNFFLSDYLILNILNFLY